MATNYVVYHLYVHPHSWGNKNTFIHKQTHTVCCNITPCPGLTSLESSRCLIKPDKLNHIVSLSCLITSRLTWRKHTAATERNKTANSRSDDGTLTLTDHRAAVMWGDTEHKLLEEQSVTVLHKINVSLFSLSQHWSFTACFDGLGFSMRGAEAEPAPFPPNQHLWGWTGSLTVCQTWSHNILVGPAENGASPCSRFNMWCKVWNQRSWLGLCVFSMRNCYKSVWFGWLIG